MRALVAIGPLFEGGAAMLLASSGPRAGLTSAAARGAPTRRDASMGWSPLTRTSMAHCPSGGADAQEGCGPEHSSARRECDEGSKGQRALRSLGISRWV